MEKQKKIKKSKPQKTAKECVTQVKASIISIGLVMIAVAIAE